MRTTKNSQKTTSIHIQKKLNTQNQDEFADEREENTSPKKSSKPQDTERKSPTKKIVNKQPIKSNSSSNIKSNTKSTIKSTSKKSEQKQNISLTKGRKQHEKEKKQEGIIKNGKQNRKGNESKKQDDIENVYQENDGENSEEEDEQREEQEDEQGEQEDEQGEDREEQEEQEEQEDNNPYFSKAREFLTTCFFKDPRFFSLSFTKQQDDHHHPSVFVRTDTWFRYFCFRDRLAFLCREKIDYEVDRTKLTARNLDRIEKSQTLEQNLPKSSSIHRDIREMLEFLLDYLCKYVEEEKSSYSFPILTWRSVPEIPPPFRNVYGERVLFEENNETWFWIEKEHPLYSDLLKYSGVPDATNTRKLKFTKRPPYLDLVYLIFQDNSIFRPQKCDLERDADVVDIWNQFKELRKVVGSNIKEYAHWFCCKMWHLFSVAKVRTRRLFPYVISYVSCYEKEGINPSQALFLLEENSWTFYEGYDFILLHQKPSFQGTVTDLVQTKEFGEQIYAFTNMRPDKFLKRDEPLLMCLAVASSIDQMSDSSDNIRVCGCVIGNLKEQTTLKIDFVRGTSYSPLLSHSLSKVLYTILLAHSSESINSISQSVKVNSPIFKEFQRMGYSKGQLCKHKLEPGLFAREVDATHCNLKELLREHLLSWARSSLFRVMRNMQKITNKNSEFHPSSLFTFQTLTEFS